MVKLRNCVPLLIIALLVGVQIICIPAAAVAQTLTNVTWALYEVQENPAQVLASWEKDTRYSVDGVSTKSKLFATTEFGTSYMSYRYWGQTLEGIDLWSELYAYDFTPPPYEFRSGGSVDMTVSGHAECYRYVEGTGTVTFLSGVWIEYGLADSSGEFISRPANKYLEIGERTSYAETLQFSLPGRQARTPVSDQFFRIQIRAMPNFETESGEDGNLIIAWIYRAVEDDGGTVETTATSQPAATTTQKPDDSGKDALDILGRIAREVAQERIQNQVRSSLEEMGQWLTDQWDSFTGWAGSIVDDTVAWMEGPLVDEYGDDFGAESPELPGFSWDEINEQLGERIKPVAGVNEESMGDLFDAVEQMLWEEDPVTGRYAPRRTSTVNTIDMHLNDGSSVKIGILVTPEGRIMYTPNGKDYFTSLQSAVDPSYYEQATGLYTDTKKWIFDSLFTGSTGNPDTDLQNKVASEVLEDLRVQLNAGEAPKSMVDWTEGKMWTNVVQEPLKNQARQMLWQQAEEALKNHITGEGRIPSAEDLEYLDMFEDMKFQFEGGEMTTPKAWAEYKSQTGLDLFELTKAGEVAVAGGEFAVEAVKTMARGLQDTDFAVRSRAYIEERKAGYPIELIYERMKTGELPELDIGAAKMASGGTSSMMASAGIDNEAQIGVMFTMYEQAYQRYLLAQQMGRQP